MQILRRRYRGQQAQSQKENPFRSLVFTMLSARTRDDQTEKVYQKLLEQYPTPQLLAKADVKDVRLLLKTIGLFEGKARNVVALSKRLVEEFGGEVPDDFDALKSLPGVGRKTANCVLVYAFNKPAICVDTHVFRVANRLGWVHAKDPERTEKALRDVLPKKWWLVINHTFVLFGREVCVPGKPKCWQCPVREFCEYKNKTEAPR